MEKFQMILQSHMPRHALYNNQDLIRVQRPLARTTPSLPSCFMCRPESKQISRYEAQVSTVFMLGIIGGLGGFPLELRIV